MSVNKAATPVSAGTEPVAAVRPIDDAPTAGARVAVETALILADGAGRMLVDHNGDLINYARVGRNS